MKLFNYDYYMPLIATLDNYTLECIIIVVVVIVVMLLIDCIFYD